MKRPALLALAFALAACAEETPLADIDCPLEAPPTHTVDCSRFTRDTGTAVIAFDIAVLTPRAGTEPGHLIYLPGGPGEAPVSDDGLFPALTEHAAGRTIILFNPRGTEGTSPRMECNFGDVIWTEEFADDIARDSLVACRGGIVDAGIDPALFTSAAIADDVDALVRALAIERAGIWGISYGTETGLHLLAAAPDWLEFAILDSVSLPGRAGIREFRAARDRFLELVNRLCFAQGQCNPAALGGARTLLEWTARFDETPLTIAPREDTEWAFDSIDMLDWLAQLGGYTDGADIAMGVVEGLSTMPQPTLDFIGAVAADNVEFAINSLPLLMEAYSDTEGPDDEAALREPGLYPTNTENALVGLKFQRLWHGDRPMETPFVPEAASPRPVPVPTLLLAGGVDPLTPAEWAYLLDRRFSGLERHFFPLLGHALSAGYTTDTVNPAIAEQMRCANLVVGAFLDPTSTLEDTCAGYAAEENG